MKNPKILLFFSLLMLVVLVASGNYYNQKIQKTNNSSIIHTNAPTNNTKEFIIDDKKVYLYSFNDRIDIYVKNSNADSDKYIGYHIKHSIKPLDANTASSNYDVWNLAGVNEFSRTSETSFLNTKNIVSAGEWELALLEVGASDFVGGVQHGDEVTTDFKLYVNNTLVETDRVIEEEAEEIKLITKSDLYRDNTKSKTLDKFAEHTKTYVFTNEGLLLSQKVEFIEDINLNKSYLGMFPILRKSERATGEQITDTFKLNEDSQEFDVSSDGFDIPKISNVKSNEASIYGKQSGISATVRILNKSPNELSPTFSLSNAVNYNKFYFAFNQDGMNIEKDDIWEQETIYNIKTSN